MVRIGIDINNTLRDNITQFKKYYKKLIDESFEIEDKDITSFEMDEVFPFESHDAYNRFRYEDCPFELYGRAECVDKNLKYIFNDWIQKTLRDFDTDEIPHVFMFSPFEIGLTIQSTYAFLAKIGCRIREMDFPIDSMTMWDKCDIMITTNPYLLEGAPEGKYAVKINKPYNTEVETEYSFDSLLELIQDKDEKIIKLIEKLNEELYRD